MGHEDLVGELTRRSGGDRCLEWKPRLFFLNEPAAVEPLHDLLRSNLVVEVVDTLAEQLRELAVARHPAQRDRAAVDRAAAELLGTATPAEYGVWAFYPWSGRLVHLLPPDQFQQVRTDRNRHKILDEEQQRLSNKTIAVAGLSVGLSAAVALAMEGIGGRFRLADFDTLSLSNLNRLRAGVADLGVNKAVLAARQLFEINPYLEVSLFSDGVTLENLDQFLAEPLDLLVEECDDFFLKVRLREEARRRRVPVIMDTSDRGLLDVERFDLEPARPLFHGLIGATTAEEVRAMSPDDKLLTGLCIVSARDLSPRLRASLLEMKQTVAGWPQLASAVCLGGALVADTARRLLLGELRESGRYYVDLAQLIRDGASVAAPVMEAPSSVYADFPHPPLPPRGSTDHLSREETEFLVHYASLAPSAGNAQPWKFVSRHDALEILPGICPMHSLNFHDRATFVAIGAACLNLTLAAERLSLATTLEPFPEGASSSLVARATFQRISSSGQASPLFNVLGTRVTNRKLGAQETLPDEVSSMFRTAANLEGADFRPLVDRESLQRLARCVGASDRLRFLNERLYREMMSEVRWTAAETERTRDGIDVATLELSPLDRVVIQCVSDRAPLEVMARAGGGAGLAQSALKLIGSSSACGLITLPGRTPADYFQGGRAMQRVWLTAAAAGWAVHPMTPLCLYCHTDEGDGQEISSDIAAELAAMRRELLELFSVPSHAAVVMLFRIFKADTPERRSLRKPLDQILKFNVDD